MKASPLFLFLLNVQYYQVVLCKKNVLLVPKFIDFSSLKEISRFFLVDLVIKTLTFDDITLPVGARYTQTL